MIVPISCRSRSDSIEAPGERRKLRVHYVARARRCRRERLQEGIDDLRHVGAVTLSVRFSQSYSFGIERQILGSLSGVRGLWLWGGASGLGRPGSGHVRYMRICLQKYAHIVSRRQAWATVIQRVTRRIRLALHWAAEGKVMHLYVLPRLRSGNPSSG